MPPGSQYPNGAAHAAMGWTEPHSDRNTKALRHGQSVTMDAVSQLGIDDARGIIVVRPDVGTRDAGTPAGFDDMPAHDLDRRRRRAWLGHSGLVQCAAASSRPKEQLMDRANSSRACTASATRLPIRRSSWIMPNSTARRACRVTCLDAAHQLRQRSSWTLSGLTKGLSVPNERRNSRFSPKYHWPGRSHSPSRIIDGWRSSPFWAI